jgi:hypothetical protein
MQLLGARLTIIPSDNGRQTEKLTKDMISEAYRVARETGAYITAQMENTDALKAYPKFAREIWEQTGGRIDGFVQSVGTAGSIRGTSEALRKYDASRWSRPNLLSSPVGRPACTRSMASAPATWCRSGMTGLRTRSNQCPPQRPRRWRFG